MNVKKMVVISMLLSIAIVLNILEGFIPIPIPGVRLGLANIVILIMLYDFKWYEAGILLLLRILLVGLLRGNIFQLQWFMSLSGGLLSFLAMVLLSRIKFFSVIGVSIVGAVFHATGQIIVAMIVLETSSFIYYLPLIAILSTVTGVLTGIIAQIYLKRGLTKEIIKE